MSRTRRRRRLRLLGLRALKATRRHYVTVVSAVVLGTAGVLAAGNASFERPAQGSRVPDAEIAPPAAPAASAPAASAHRRLAIVYLVTDDAQGGRVVDTHGSLVWDMPSVEGDLNPAPFILYLIAGTPEQEAIAVQNINVYGEIAHLQNIDMRVVDLRPHRRPAANTGAP